MDQILETDPWSQIDNFVQHNFMQNTLNEFNKRVTLDPKLTPADSKSPGKKRATSSARTPRKSQTSQTNEEKPTEKKKDDLPANDGRKPKERKKRVTKKNESGKKNGEKEKRTSDSKQKEEKSKATVKQSKREKEKSKDEHRCREATSSKKTAKKVVDAPTSEIKTAMPIREDQIKNVTKNSDMISVNTSGGPNSKSSKIKLKTSTPKRDISRISNSIGKENAITERNVSASKTGSSVRNSASVERHCKEDICATTNLNNNYNIFVKDENVKKETCEKGQEIKEEKKPKNCKTLRPLNSQATTSKCSKHLEKIATTEKKQIGKFEKRLLEKRERRLKTKIRLHERKAERAMEEFSHHVLRIVKKMGYLPDNDDNTSDSFEESSYYSEYTLHPSSESELSSSEDKSGTDSTVL